MANAKAVQKVVAATQGKPEEIVAVTCPVCKARTYRKGDEGCPQGCVEEQKKTSKKAKEQTEQTTPNSTESSEPAGNE